MANVLSIPKGIDSIPQQQIPNEFSSSWFIGFIRSWLRAADVRNATAGPGISITGQGINPATISFNAATLPGITVTAVIPAITVPGGTQGQLKFVNGLLTVYIAPT